MLKSTDMYLIVIFSFLLTSCAADEAIKAGTNCDESCPVGAQKVSAKEAHGSCGGDGSFNPETFDVSAGGQCVGSGECQVVCLYPKCDEGQTLVITADEFRCEAGLDPCARVDCSGNGRCRNNNGQAQCICDRGYEADGLACVPLDGDDPDGDVSDGDVFDCEPECAEGYACEGSLCRKNGAPICGYIDPASPDRNELCRISGGTTYTQGCNEGTPNCPLASRPRVRVTLTRTSHIDRHEVTNRRYAAFLTDNPGVPVPGCSDGDSPWDDNTRTVTAALYDHPVTCVTATQAQAFCEWAGKRLPTEAEWEAAARGTTGDAYPWGNEFDSNAAQCWRNWETALDPATMCANNGYDSGACPGESAPDLCSETAPVVDGGGDSTKSPGNSPLGCSHMAGNVAEWVADGWKADHEDCEMGCSDPLTSPTAGRVIRGGSWREPAGSITTWTREQAQQARNLRDTGFRCLLPAP